MSVPELLKAALPVPSQCELSSVGGGNNNNSNSGTPLRKVVMSTGTPVGTNSGSGDKSESIGTTPAIKGRTPPKPPAEFYKDLQQFHERRGTPVMHMPKISGRVVDLHRLYSEVTERGGFLKVNMRDEWDEVLPAALDMNDKCVNATSAVKHIYRRCLEKYERLNYFGEDPDKMEALEAALEPMENIGGGRSRGGGGGSRYPSMIYSSMGGSSHSALNAVPMSYNYRQHIVNMDRRRTYKMSTDLHKHSSYERLMLSLISPLPNEQDFAINVCTLMANESKHTLRLNEYPKLLDVLLAHAGVFADTSLRQLYHHVYTNVRRHSLLGFWRDLLHDKPQILELYAATDEMTPQSLHKVDMHPFDSDDDDAMVGKHLEEEMEASVSLSTSSGDDYLAMDFLNLGRGEGTQEYVGQRVQQIMSIVRNLSFFDENLPVFVKNRTFMRFIVMSANIRWGNLHNQALDIAGNVANDLDLLDPTTDDLSRNLLATLCDGIQGMDRAVIINSLEILYKLCQKDSNEEHINKCLNLKFYQTLCLFLSLNDIMLLIFTLEAIYALTSMGARSCHLVMQVRGVIDQLVSLITVEAQSYGPDGCILMRVVETVPGNMLPIVAQNIANLQNVAVIQKQQQQQQQQQLQLQHVTPIQPQQVPAHELQQAPSHLTEAQATTAPTPPQPQQITAAVPQQIQMPQNYTHEDEQYALAWLGATFERAASVDSRVEQQELYRMYLSHCQKSGKHSVVNHLQFPRLVRLIFNNAVGPVAVRSSDGTELPGFHYVAIRVRAQPLPIQSKTSSLTSSAHTPPKTSGDSKLTTKPDLAASGRKIKKKPKLQEQQQHQLATTNNASAATATTSSSASAVVASNTLPVVQGEQSSPLLVNVVATAAVTDSVKIDTTTIITPPTTITAPLSAAQTAAPMQEDQVSSTTASTLEIPKTPKMEEQHKPTPVTQQFPAQPVDILSTSTQSQPQQQQQQLSVQQQHQQAQPSLQAQPSSSLIKSLLANKVNQRQLKQKELNAASTSAAAQTSTTAATTSATTSATTQQHQQSQQPIKVAGAAISAFVNNPLMQNTSVKVGQTTIKPLNPQTQGAHVEKKQIVIESCSAPPPLAPLSGSNVAKDASGRPVIIANQMLVEILDKKASDPPIPATIVKRKIEETTNIGTESAKRLALVDAFSGGVVNTSTSNDTPVTPSKNAANLYAEMAASILEDEDLEDIPPLPDQATVTQSLIIPAKMQQMPAPSTMQNVQRQLLFQSNQPPHLKLTTTHGGQTQQIPTAMATIKTDQGLQTVPVILQQKQMDQSQPTQIIQQVIQQSGVQQQQQQTTQYVLATNPQGQTYLVAQQQPQPQQQMLQQQQQQQQQTQTVLVTQTPQQHSAGTKTIIILQQQSLPTQQQQQQQQQQQSQIITSGGQKMIMTTPQGQQVLVTQRASQQSQPQFFINPQTGVATQIHLAPQQQPQQLQRQLIQSPALAPPQPQQQMLQQPQPGQISPSLLSQLNHIPATIKLHQPQPQQQQLPQQHQQQATISRMGKTVSIVHQGGASTTAALQPPVAPIQIPQLQQHQSIIQQHIISGPPPSSSSMADKQRQVILGAGRAIEIKETVITQAQPQPPPQQQSQLNSQTIITTQPAAAQQQLRAVIEQQQQHPSIIQQKITVPVPQQQQQVTPVHLQPQQQLPTQGQILMTQKINEPPATLMQTSLHTKSVSQAQTVVQTNLPQANTAQQATIGQTTINKKPAQQQQQSQGQSAAAATQKPTGTGPPPLSTAATIYTSNTTITSTTPTTTNTNQPQRVATTKDNKNDEPNAFVSVAASTTTSAVVTTAAVTPPATNVVAPPQAPLAAVDANWLYICDWRNCPRRKFKSLADLQHHTCSVHCPDHLDVAAEIFCQWGPGPGLCDGIPRKRYSLMTHLIDRHITVDSLRAAVQRRIAAGTTQLQPTQPPVTIVRNVDQSQRGSTASPALSSSSSTSSLPSSSAAAAGGAGSSAIHAIKRHTADFINPKELMDENEGPVTKSIRLTAALILRNLVSYTSTAKRSLRRYEPHLANVALSNVESSGAISHILYELNN